MFILRLLIQTIHFWGSVQCSRKVIQVIGNINFRDSWPALYKKSGNLLLRLFETIGYVCSSFPKKGERGILWVFASWVSLQAADFMNALLGFIKHLQTPKAFKTHPERFTESKALILEGYGNVAKSIYDLTNGILFMKTKFLIIN